ncbi:MAG: indolepyruvate oxidoreductase subunit beta family protein [Halieaceae bacterium]
MTDRTINMVAAALGGEGGGVFTNWVIGVAEREDWLCQTTSLAGVAQRTGATIYYLEFFPRSAVKEQAPVMSLFPAQGDIDIAIASEVAEAARMVQRGFVTAERTTLIASDHRVYSIAEKAELGDGTIDPLVLQEIAGRYAQQYIHYDMLALANEHNAVISSVLLGALAGSGVLPFPRESFEAEIREAGKAVDVNLAAFSASFQRALSGGVEQFEPSVAAEPVFVVPQATSAAGAELLRRLEAFPESCREILYHGLDKCVDYQDYAYAHQFLDEVRDVLALDDGRQDYRLTRETGRYLALWMCFEDIPRVAQFKTRAARMDKVRDEVMAEPDQFFDVTEFFRPRVEEMCSLLPPRLGNYVLQSSSWRKFLNLFTGGKQLRTNTIGVFFSLRFLAGLRRFRRGMLGYQHEHAMIGRWLTVLRDAAGNNPELALELAESGRLVKGYGDTRARTTAQMLAILQRVEEGEGVSADQLKAWRSEALADDTGEAFGEALAA